MASHVDGRLPRAIPLEGRVCRARQRRCPFKNEPTPTREDRFETPSPRAREHERLPFNTGLYSIGANAVTPSVMKSSGPSALMTSTIAHFTCCPVVGKVFSDFRAVTGFITPTLPDGEEGR